ncbi:MAG: shikimate dehydrogenase, partial [Flavobacteriales bacterium]|nr:shikimate dehydrogenase [Flavobacteriales bacterium]
MCAFGLIGKNISYSYSARWFADQFKERHLPYTYLNYDVENVAALETLLKTTEVLGFNVTIPYKSAIIPLLAAIDSE